MRVIRSAYGYPTPACRFICKGEGGSLPALYMNYYVLLFALMLPGRAGPSLIILMFAYVCPRYLPPSSINFFSSSSVVLAQQTLAQQTQQDAPQKVRTLSSSSPSVIIPAPEGESEEARDFDGLAPNAANSGAPHPAKEVRVSHHQS